MKGFVLLIWAWCRLLDAYYVFPQTNSYSPILETRFGLSSGPSSRCESVLRPYAGSEVVPAHVAQNSVSGRYEVLTPQSYWSRALGLFAAAVGATVALMTGPAETRFLLLLVACQLPAATAIISYKNFQRNYGGQYSDLGLASIVVDDTFYVAGYAGSTDTAVIKLDINGNILWNRTTNCQASSYSSPQMMGLAPSGDGGCVMATRKYFQCNQNKPMVPYAVRYSSAGTVVWQQFIGDLPSFAALGVTLLKSGKFAVVGMPGFIAVLKAENGDVEWYKPYGTSDTVLYRGIELSAGGELMAVGYGLTPYSRTICYPCYYYCYYNPCYAYTYYNSECWVLRTDKDGGILFSNKYPGYTYQHCYDLTQLSDGNVVVVGEASNSYGIYGYLAKMSIVGGISSTASLGLGSDTVFAVTQMKDGNLAVLLRSYTKVAGKTVIWLVYTSTLLAPISDRIYTYDSVQEAHYLNVTDDGTVVIGGNAYVSSYDYDYFLIVDNCGPGLFRNPTGGCDSCLTDCSVCNSPTDCSKCTVGFFLSNTGGTPTCGATCPYSFYAEAGVCKSCVADCKTCLSVSTCTVCQPGFYMIHDLSGQYCVGSCPSGYIQTVDMKCVTGTAGCPTNCLACLSSTYCIVCVPTYYQYAVDASHINCEECLPSCYSCSTGTTCANCSTGLYIYSATSTSDQCVASCPKGTYADKKNDPRRCSPCKSHCKECIDGETCVKCENEYYIDTFQDSTQMCVNPCRLGYYNTTDGNCKACLKNCKNCTTDFRCTECYPSYFIMQGDDKDMCVSDCGTKHYPAGNGACGSCDFRCLACTNATHTSCPICDLSEKGVDKKGSLTCVCGKGYIANLTAKACQPCTDVFCMDCDEKNASVCYECDSTYPGLVYNPLTHQCDCPIGTYKDVGRCLSCSPLCEKCTGPGNTNCIAYRCSENSYALSTSPTTCLYMCNSDDPDITYYIDTITDLCEKLICDPACKGCTGKTSSECIRCSNPTLSQFQGNCRSGCPDSYYSSDEQVCLPCSFGCKSCVNSTVCANCSRPLFLEDGVCVSQCSKHRYATEKSTCVRCTAPCIECGSEVRCWRCASKYYLYNERCWSGEDKPENVYAVVNSTGGMFLPCDVACRGCTGAGYDHCVACNSAAGYVKVAIGVCQKPNCAAGYYAASEIADENSSGCEPCPKACATCVGNSSTECLTCASAYIQAEFTGTTVHCKACTEVNPGLKPDPTAGGQCVEICGDGIHLGAAECDDGNTLSGDGCSSDCKIEPDFVCIIRGEKRPDYCYTTIPPRPSLRVWGSNSLAAVSFSRPVVVPDSPKTLLDTISAQILRGSGACKFSLEPAASSLRLLRGQTVTGLEFALRINCSLSGVEQLRVVFADPGLFRDENAVPMVEDKAAARLTRMKWMSSADELAVTTAGSGLANANTAIMCLSLVQYLFQSVALGSFWALVNMLQILYYTPVIDTPIPGNLESILTNYLSVSKLTIPIPIDLSSFLPTSWINDMTSNLLSVNLQEFGLSSLSFLYNFYDQLFTWISLVACYLILVLLDLIRPKDRFLFIPKWKQDYVFNAVIRVLIETYLDMTFYSLLNLFSMQTSSNSLMVISTVAAAIAFSLTLVFLCCCTRLTSLPAEEYATPEFELQYSSVVEEFKASAGPFRRGYYCVFLVRRLLFVFVLLLLTNSVTAQLATSIALDLCMAGYILSIRPFKSRFDNYLNVFNELVIAFVHSMILLIRRAEYAGTNSESLIGWVCVAAILSSAAQVWISMLIPMCRTIVGYVLRCFVKLSGPSADEGKRIRTEHRPKIHRRKKRVRPERESDIASLRPRRSCRHQLGNNSNNNKADMDPHVKSACPSPAVVKVRDLPLRKGSEEPGEIAGLNEGPSHTQLIAEPMSPSRRIGLSARDHPVRGGDSHKQIEKIMRKIRAEGGQRVIGDVGYKS